MPDLYVCVVVYISTICEYPASMARTAYVGARVEHVHF